MHPCELCFAKDNPSIKQVPGMGPKRSSVMLVGEGPGKMENNIGKPFIGPTGKELDNTYLPIAGLNRQDLFVCNTFCCKWADSSGTPPPEIIKCCADTHLRGYLESVKPETVVLMGGIANSLLDLDIDVIHGTGRIGKLWDKEYRIFSTYHPALGMHISSKMQALLDDFAKLKYFVRGELDPIVDEIQNPAYYWLTTAEQVDCAMEGLYDEPIAVDTESKLVWKGWKSTKRYIGWCATFCIFPGEAFMVRVSDAAAWKRFGYHLQKFLKILMHNAPHDVRVLLNAGIKLKWERIKDTMSLAYIIANVAKGLKPLSHQLLGVTARNFEDVVKPWGVRAAMEYFEKASLIDWPEPEQEETGELVLKNCPDCKGSGVLSIGRGKSRQFFDCYCDGGQISQMKMTRKQGLNKKISRLVTDYIKTGDSIDPYERFEKWMEDGCALPLVEAMGPPPLPSVDLVPDREIDDYAMLDAHSTRRIYPIELERMRKIRRSVRAN